MMLNHTGMPVDRDADDIAAWRKSMEWLARGAKRVLQDIRTRHGRLEMDDRQHPPVRA